MCSPILLKQGLQVGYMAVGGCGGTDSRVNNNGSSFHTANNPKDFTFCNGGDTAGGI